MTEAEFPDRTQGRASVRYVQAIRAHWVLVVSIVAAAVLLAGLFVVTTPKQFKATTDISITPVSATDDTFPGFSMFRQSLDGSLSVVTAARLLNSAAIRVPARAALEAAGVDATTEVQPLSQADIVAVTSTAESAAEAARAANLFARTAVETRTDLFQRELTDHVARLERRIAAIPAVQRPTSVEYSALAQRVGELKGFIDGKDPTIAIAAAATPPEGASWPRPLLTLMAAFVASSLLAVGLALLLEVANPRVSREDELQLDQRLPILARIPRLTTGDAHGYLTGNRPLPPVTWKGYRTLRAGLATAGPDGSAPRSVLVTSPSPGDGKTMTAVNLAITVAAADIPVTLVDADLHRPMIATIFNTPTRTNGFVNALANRTPASSMLVPAPAHPRLKLLLSRREQLAQMRFFDANRVRRVVDELQQDAGVVIFDSPPLTEVAEALELAAAVDAVLIAVRLGHTRRDRLNDLLDLLYRRGIAPIGFVVTTRSTSSSESPYDYHGEIGASPPAAAASARRIVSLHDK